MGIHSRQYAMRSPRAALVLTCAVVLSGCPGPTTSGPEPAAENAELFPSPYVRGFVSTVPGARGADFAPLDKGGPVGIYVPGVTVVLRDTRTNTETKALTDLSGRYNFAQVANSTYVLCWQLRGFLPGCTKPFTMDSRPMHPMLIRIPADINNFPLMLHGNVRLKDGELRLFEPMASLNVFARVRARTSRGAFVDSALVNTFGDYVLPLRSNQETLRLEGVLEGLVETATLAADLLQRPGIARRADLVLDNNRPRPHLLAQVGGRKVRAAPRGATIDLIARAQDVDGDPLRFRWILPEGAGSLSATNGPSIQWRLPNAPGMHRVQLLVGDGKGGYARTDATISTDSNGLRFSGLVNATDAPVVAAARVEINGRTTQTDANGRFVLAVPDTSRYVVNITKNGYNLISRIYTDPVGDGRWRLTRATTSSVDPRAPITVVDDRKSQRCAGPVSLRLRWREYPEAALRRVVDIRSGRVARTASAQPIREQTGRECGPGARIQIPANALVDANGNAPAGNVDVTVFTVDLNSPDDMPGDYTAANRQGQQRVMQSWGAAEVTVNAGNTAYNLRAGDSATLTIPIDPGQLAAAGPDPGTIPLLRYDEGTGVWEEVGAMTRAGNNYVAKVGHFTPFNADQLKVDQSCIQVHSPPSGSGFAGLPASYRIEFTIPRGNDAPYVIDRLGSNSPPYNALINLPNNVDVIMVPYDAATLKPYGTFIVNSGGTQSPVTPNPPDYDFSACQASVTLYDVTDPPPGPDAFLHGLYSFESINLNDISDADSALWKAATDDYYDQVDPRLLRRTLTDFRSRHGFPTGETRVIYANSADLGFGRDMHCVRKPATDGLEDDIACYVSNYGNEITSDALDFTNAVNNNGLVATVAMEYSRIENDPGPGAEYTDPERVVKFFVYGAGGGIVTAANLDGRGARPIPQLCLVCHGGATGGTGLEPFPDRTSVKLGSRFIAFDLSAYTIVDGVNPAFNKAAQQAAFKTLNNDIVKGTQPGAPIVELIDSMYLNNVAIQREDFSIAGWNANAARQSMYREVMGKSCRMCHASQPQTNLAGLNLRFNTAQQVIDLGPIVPLRVCIQHVMPHAFVTHDSLWQSIAPHQPAQLQSFGSTQVPGGYGTSCGAPPAVPPAPTVPTYDSQMGDFFETRCAGCHSGPKIVVSQTDACNNGFSVMASLIDLNNPAGYNGIINQPSRQRPGMVLVSPGSLAQSYLWQKVNDSHLGAPVNGCGVVMPYNSPMSAGELQQVSDWITGGALKN